MACCVCGSSEVRYARKGYVVCNIEQHTLCGRVANSAAFRTFMASANNDTDPIELTDMPFEILYEIFAHLQDEPEQLRQLAMMNSRLHALLAPLFLGNILNPVMTKDLVGVDNETIRTIVKGVYRVAARNALSSDNVQRLVHGQFSRILTDVDVADYRYRDHVFAYMIAAFMQDGHLGLMQYTFQKAVQFHLWWPHGDAPHAYRHVIKKIERWPPHTWTHIHRWIIKSDWWPIIQTIRFGSTIQTLTFHALSAAIRDNAMDVIDLLNKAEIVIHLSHSQWQILFSGMAGLDRDQIFAAMIPKAWRVSKFTRDIIEHSIRQAGDRAYLQAVVDWAGQQDDTRDLMQQAMAALNEIG